MMHFSSRSRWTAAVSPLAIALAAVATPQSALAQETIPPETGQTNEQSVTDNTLVTSPAEEAAADDTEIVVTGFRAALQSAVSTKKRNEQIVESVSAEDIGKLPDQSIAESIARLPGLTSQRIPGSGRTSYISIRGLGPDFSTTTLNGRLQTSTSDVRNVEYDQFPSEVVSGVDIYKTPNASLIGQGIVGSVDIKTIRPLNYNQRVIAIGAKGIYTDAKKLNPDTRKHGFRVNATYVDKMSDVFGVAFSAAYTDEPYHVREERAWGWSGDPARIDGLATWNNSTQVKRLGLTGTVQAELTPALTLTVDGFYSNFKDSQDRRGIEVPLGCCTALPTNTTVEDGIVTQATFTDVQAVVNNHNFKRKSDLYSLGGNLKWDGDNGWAGFLDFGWSKTDRLESILETNAGTGPGGLGANDTVTVELTDHGIFIRDNVLDFSDPTQIFITDPNGWGGGAPLGRQHGYFNNRTVDDEIIQLAGELDRELNTGPLKALRVGANYVRRVKSLTPDEFFLTVASGALQAAVPSDFLLSPIQSWVGFGPVIAYDARGLLNDGFFTLTPNDDPNVTAKGFEVTEKVASAFAMLDLNQEFGSGVLTGNIGVLAQHTDQQSDGFRVIRGTRDVEPFTDGDTFWDILPSASLNFRFHSDFVLRAAASRQIMRPRMDDMATRFTYGLDLSTNPPIITGSSGNPKLRPYRAWAFDASIEKYWGTKGYIALQAFYKKLDSMIYNQDSEFDWTDFPLDHPLITTRIGTINIPINAKGGSLYGVELGGTIPFEEFTSALTGFGVTGGVSYTVPKVKPDASSPSEDIPGFSRWVANGTVYFENSGFNARASARYRSSYRGDFSGFGASRERRRIKPETIIDAQVGYDFQPGTMLSGLSVFLQGINLTDEPLISHAAQDSDLTLNYEEFGRRFMLGATYKFGAAAAAAPVDVGPPPPPLPAPPPATQTCADGSVVLATDVCPMPPPPPPPPAPEPERG
jgi:iron complex outermembrane receptor protein